MCWIFGYAWKEQSWSRVLIHWLERLEYRGYDSAGLAILHDGQLHIAKTVWRVWVLAEKTQSMHFSGRHQWIAHTRRATHGGVTVENSHPHISNDANFAVVHNWIIENYHKLKQELIAEGYHFSSDTDTEVIANLLQKYWNGDFIATVKKVTTLIRGAYALCIMHVWSPETLIWVRLWSPLLFGYRNEEFYFSSDAQALTGYAEKIVYMEDWDMLVLQGNDYITYSAGKPVIRDVEELDQEQLDASKWSYKHFMKKEIDEQAVITKRLFKWRVDFDAMSLTAESFYELDNAIIKHVHFLACGTSYHSGLLWSLYFQNIAGIRSKATIASEFENTHRFVDDESLFVFTSQSGETADCIDILKQLHEQHAKTFGVVNVPWSTIARLTDMGLFTRAGTEVWVASTKAFTTQCLCLYMTALYFGKKNGMRRSSYKNALRELQELPMHIETVLEQSDYIRSIAQQIADAQRFFFIWRGYQVPITYESALKMKEITYLSSQWYPAGELKHGSLALIDEQTPTIFFMPDDEQFEKNMSSMHEIQAREGKVLVVSDKQVSRADWQITIPSTIPELSPILTAVVGQLLSYHVADILGRDIDKPRNLAKSVTVK